MSKAFLVLALVALLVAAWMTRYEVTTTANDVGMAYVLDRWSGRVEVLHGKRRLDVEREAVLVPPKR